MGLSLNGVVFKQSLPVFSSDEKLAPGLGLTNPVTHPNSKSDPGFEMQVRLSRDPRKFFLIRFAVTNEPFMSRQRTPIIRTEYSKGL
jgi:hypothetical protein